MMKTFRKSWYHFPDIASIPCQRALSHFTPAQQCKLICENSGAFQSSQQKAKWTEEFDGACQLCAAMDSRTHQLLECPIGTECRESYVPLLQWLETSGSEFAEFPYVTVHPNAEALICSVHALPFPKFEQPVLDFVQDLIRRGVQLHWFTDGACQQALDPSCAYSAFAIAIDLCEHDDERVQLALQAECSGLVPPSFQKILASRTCGEQDILRAEISAAVVTLLGVGEGVIHIDSQAALLLLQLALTVESVDQLMSRDHFDLLVQVWERRHSISCELVKVKAHTDISGIKSPLQQYWTWGNVFVDEIAVSARENLIPDLVKQFQLMDSEMTEQITMLTQVRKLQLELRVIRARQLWP